MSLHDSHIFTTNSPSSKGQICASLPRPLIVSGLFNNIIYHSIMGRLIPLHEANEFVQSINGSVPALCAIHLNDGDGSFLMLHKFLGLISNFGRHGISVGFKDSSRHQTWLPFRDPHHNAMEMKHCYGVQTYEYYTIVEYNLGLEAFFHAMAFLNSAISLPYWWRRKISMSFPILVQLNLVTCHGHFMTFTGRTLFYSMVTLSNEQVLELPSSNYLMKVRNGYTDARKFESFN